MARNQKKKKTARAGETVVEKLKDVVWDPENLTS
jgi:hypothetical protein